MNFPECISTIPESCEPLSCRCIYNSRQGNEPYIVLDDFRQILEA